MVYLLGVSVSQEISVLAFSEKSLSSFGLIVFYFKLTVHVNMQHSVKCCIYAVLILAEGDNYEL